MRPLVSEEGKVVGTVCIIMGLLYMAMPFAIVRGNFTLIWGVKDMPHALQMRFLTFKSHVQDKPQPAVQCFDGADEPVMIPGEVGQAFLELCSDWGATPIRS